MQEETGKLRPGDIVALLTWSEQYSVGVKTMDNQHIAMIDMLNELYEAMMEGNALGVTGPLLHKLVEYTKNHFSSEEQMLAACGYPDLQEHIAHHKQLIEEVNQHVADYERQNLFMPIPLLHFLRDWIATHIQKEDRSYGPWVNRTAGPNQTKSL